jgi:NAD(P)-dependent dehydrogenase (short-subunit alcohol dehydrogenase family)
VCWIRAASRQCSATSTSTYTAPWRWPAFSKHAAAAATEALRLELRPQGTRVMGVYVGLIDTEMTAGIQRPKVSPQEVATGVMQGIERDEDYIRADARAEQLWSLMHGAPALISRAINPP